MRLQRRLRPGEATVTVIDVRSYMTYQPFLPEAAAGNLEPRHVVVPLRRVLDRCTVLKGLITGIDTSRHSITVQVRTGEQVEVPYDQLVMAPGSVPRTLPIPGLAEHGIGFKRVEEAIFLRNHVIDQIDSAASTRDPQLRARALKFVFVGGGYAGVEALAELEDMARYATRYYSAITAADLHWYLVEATGRILPEVGEEMGRYTVTELRRRGIDVRLDTRLESAENGHIRLSDGTEFDSNTLVWTAGVKPNPLVGLSGLPVDDRGRLKATAELRVEGVPGHWTAGDCAAVPDLTKGPGEFCGPSAQHAVRQAKVLADNIVADLRGEPLTTYQHRYAGSVAGLGLHKGVAHVYGVKLRGWPAWLMHRIYHLSRVPTLNRKARVMTDWTTALFFRREVASLGSLQDPRREFLSYAVRPEPRPAMSGSGEGQGQ
ncbi:MAG: NAD(P)/FAD-dependent oxidoreductase [Actinomycetota bacterium]|nr:NAD(P)/FAD-dependent oxidoreductase [Actinomycetota bacterium]